jgi:hypothetical protein
MAPISYFNRVKIISLIETDVSEARVATQLGFPKRTTGKLRTAAKFVPNQQAAGIIER